ncbi:PLAT domain-containing protein 3 [Beta vulgaris subsp. vulgaris]|uniref:PLAT domain-containing protein 3 n=1 Tax=Beta vulgaris subsp. vulgaris TaxID=3555 RepID=UPI002036E991|nr:PLAT domain-containing protein 3 [Beta vulgaris subsp. vulgaris]
MEAKLILFTSIFILAPFSAFSWDDYCTHVIDVKTGNGNSATTYATVSLEFRDKYINRLNITNLQSRGIMSKSHYYFRRGNLDTFAVKGRCFNTSICSMTLSHDNTGVSPDWYVDYVEITSITPNHGCRKLKFTVNAWLAADKPPLGSASRGVYLCDEIIGQTRDYSEH